MDEHEAYLFDLQGFLVVEAALSPAEVAELDDLLESRIQADVPADADTHRFEYPFDWSPAVRRLIDHDRLRPYLGRSSARPTGSTTTTPTSSAAARADRLLPARRRHAAHVRRVVRLP